MAFKIYNQETKWKSKKEQIAGEMLDWIFSRSEAFIKFIHCLAFPLPFIYHHYQRKGLIFSNRGRSKFISEKYFFMHQILSLLMCQTFPFPLNSISQHLQGVFPNIHILFFPELLIFLDIFSGLIPIYLVSCPWTNEYCCDSHVICFLFVSIECICHSSSNLYMVISFEQVIFSLNVWHVLKTYSNLWYYICLEPVGFSSLTKFIAVARKQQQYNK